MLHRPPCVAFLLITLLAASAHAADVAPPRLSLQSSSPPALVPAALPDLQDTQALRLTLYWENDGNWVKPFDRHDRHYTAGVGFSLAWQAPWVKDLLAPVPAFGDEFARAQTDYAMGFVGALTMYTPKDIGRTKPIPDDRPFAGWSYGGLFFQRANRTTDVAHYESLEVDLGMIGPSSQAANAQNIIHETFHYTIPQGWHNQISDEPEFSLKYNRRWRLPELTVPHAGAIAAQAVPEAGFTAGSLIDDVHGGILFRIGMLPDDFGPGTLAEPADATGLIRAGSAARRDNFFSAQSFYLFARPYGRLVAHNTLLEGDNWRHDDPVTVDPLPVVYGAQVGLATHFLRYFEIAYVVTYQSPEFRHQNDWDSWASLQLSFAFSW